MEKSSIPEVVVERLPVYIQKLNQLVREGRESVSSQEMAEHLGVTSAQFRKDLSIFGGFGKQGTGYNVINLLESLRSILNLLWRFPSKKPAGNKTKSLFGTCFKISAKKICLLLFQDFPEGLLV